ncbi:MAG: hypothetical protein ACFKPT_29990 [Gloeotrichia echinulata GP01]
MNHRDAEEAQEYEEWIVRKDYRGEWGDVTYCPGCVGGGADT